LLRSKEDELAYERLLNRINRTMKAWDSHAVLFWDEGKEAQHRRLTRRMGVHNPIPSAYGVWEAGSLTKNIPLEYVLEDPVFKSSEHSYFIQLTDFIHTGCSAGSTQFRHHRATGWIGRLMFSLRSLSQLQAGLIPKASFGQERRPGDPGR
jgi:hypothetical protein